MAGVSTISTFNGANLLFAANDSAYGAALYIESGTAMLYHATIGRPARSTGSSAIHAPTGSTLELKNSMITSYDVGIRAEGEVTEDYNLLYNNRVDYDATGGGSIHYGPHDVALKDPLFANPVGEDYHLRWPSPAIGMGTNLGVTTDLDGCPRLGRMDIGAYQYWGLFLPFVRK